MSPSTIGVPFGTGRVLVFSIDELVALIPGANDTTFIEMLEQNSRVALAVDDPDSIALRCQLAWMPEIERYYK